MRGFRLLARSAICVAGLSKPALDKLRWCNNSSHVNQLTPVQRYALWSATQRQRWAGGGGEEVPARLPHITGRYYGGMLGDTSVGSVGNLVDDSLHLIPFYAPFAKTYDRIGWNREDATSTNYLFGIYGPVGEGPLEGLPLLHALDEHGPVTGTGDQEVTIDWVLPAGWYLVAVLVDATHSVEAVEARSTVGHGGLASPDSTGEGATFRKASHGYASGLPSVVPEGLDVLAASYKVLLRAA